MTSTIRFGPCCFCGEQIEADAPDPCMVQVTTSQERWQVWKAHGRCFEDRLAVLPEAPGLFDPAHFWAPRRITALVDGAAQLH